MPYQNNFGTTGNNWHIMNTVIRFICKQTVQERAERWGEHNMLQVFTKMWSENQHEKEIWFSNLYMGCQHKLVNSAVTLNCNLTANAQQWTVWLGHSLLFGLAARVTGFYISPLQHVWTFHCASESCTVSVTPVPKSGTHRRYTPLRSAVMVQCGQRCGRRFNIGLK
jgi:hypothetical protein